MGTASKSYIIQPGMKTFVYSALQHLIRLKTFLVQPIQYVTVAMLRKNLSRRKKSHFTVFFFIYELFVTFCDFL